MTPWVSPKRPSLRGSTLLKDRDRSFSSTHVLLLGKIDDFLFFLTHKRFQVRVIVRGPDHLWETQRLALGELTLTEADCFSSTTESAAKFLKISISSRFTTSASKLVQIRRTDFYSLPPPPFPPTSKLKSFEEKSNKRTYKVVFNRGLVLLELPGTLWAGGWGEGRGAITHKSKTPRCETHQESWNTRCPWRSTPQPQSSSLLSDRSCSQTEVEERRTPHG